MICGGRGPLANSYVRILNYIHAGYAYLDLAILGLIGVK